MPKFKDGQQVLIKNPGELVATILAARAGDKDQPEEKRHYQVSFEPRYYRSTSLEPVEEPTKGLERYSDEWMAEMNRFVEAGQRFIANNNDKAAWDAFTDAGRRLGWIVPIKKAGS